MTSVLGNRCIVQAFLLLLFGLVAVATCGCKPPADDRDSSETPAASRVASVEDPAEEPAAEKAPAEKAPAEKDPGEKPAIEYDPPIIEDDPAEKDPAEEPPAEEDPVEKDPAEEPPAEKDPAEKAPAKAPPAKDLTGPTDTVTVTWLPEPIPNPEAEAAEEDQMKAYTEPIPATEVKFDMVPIPGGTFTMGSPEDEAGRNADEGPQHEVKIAPFWMGKCEVTWDEYELWGMGLDKQRREMKHKANGTEPDQREKLVDAIAMPTKPYSDMTFGMGKDGFPAICMTQLAARGYCKWLSAKTGRFYRLPTEAEWEYACRAGTTTAYSFGDDPEKLDEYGWFFDNTEDVEGYQKVGLKKPNPWGLHDMHGNVCEWVVDQYVPDYYKQLAGKTTANPLVPATKLYPRVARGGCWDDDAQWLRSAARRGSDEDWKQQDPQIPQSIWFLTEVYCPGIRVVRPLKIPDFDEAKLYEWDAPRIREYQEEQAGKQ